MRETTGQPTASGVEALLERLQAEGVAAGREVADRLIADAEARARAIREAAEQEAAALLDEAKREAANLERGGREALRVAMRDAVLDLKQQLADRFKGEISRLVTRQMRDQDLLRQLIVEIVGRAAEAADVASEKRVEVLLPADVIGLDELRRRPEELREGALGSFVLGVAGELLRDGVTLGRSEDTEAGIKVRLGDRDILLDLSDRAVAGVILEHLQPRFRALLDGVIG